MRYHELFEGRDAYLFHGTALINVLTILKTGVLNGSDQYHGQPYGVSFSRDYKVAAQFGEAWDRQYPTVLVFDQRKLAQRRKLIPYHDTDDQGKPREVDEAEEVLPGDLRDLNSMISINVSPRDLHSAYNNLDWQSYMVQDHYEWTSTRQIRQAIKQLAQDPRLNFWKHRVHTKLQLPTPVSTFLARGWYEAEQGYYRNPRHPGVFAKPISDDQIDFKAPHETFVADIMRQVQKLGARTSLTIASNKTM